MSMVSRTFRRAIRLLSEASEDVDASMNCTCVASRSGPYARPRSAAKPPAGTGAGRGGKGGKKKVRLTKEQKKKHGIIELVE